LQPTPRSTSEACSLTFLPLFTLAPSPTLSGPLLCLSGEQCIRFKNHNKKITADVRIGYLFTQYFGVLKEFPHL